ncbi:hypothetical protein RZS08_31865, partial [Arthrospira platensis SPKY1]|nr:hypothetical protein [Arthrospira platensis SPKY1]
YPALGIINGMGSKGTLFSPWCAQQWFKHVESNQAIDPAVAIGRCRKVWRNQLAALKPRRKSSLMASISKTGISKSEPSPLACGLTHDISADLIQ